MDLIWILRQLLGGAMDLLWCVWLRLSGRKWRVYKLHKDRFDSDPVFLPQSAYVRWRRQATKEVSRLAAVDVSAWEESLRSCPFTLKKQDTSDEPPLSDIKKWFEAMCGPAKVYEPVVVMGKNYALVLYTGWMPSGRRSWDSWCSYRDHSHVYVILKDRSGTYHRSKYSCPGYQQVKRADLRAWLKTLPRSRLIVASSRRSCKAAMRELEWLPTIGYVMFTDKYC